MLHHFLQCLGCDLAVDHHAYSLCKACESSLLASPPLCPLCGSPVCLNPGLKVRAQVGVDPAGEDRGESSLGLITSDRNCTRPWVARINKERGGVDTYSARYLMIGQGYTVLKKWKLHRGPIFDRQVLISNDAFLSTSSSWKLAQAEAIIPIPQHFFRSWQMRGSPVDVIAQWVAAATKLPLRRVLEIGSFQGPHKRQAQRTLGERLSAGRNRFTLNQSLVKSFGPLPKSLILIDDFMTTGRTLNEAADTLKKAGVERIHAFCLGIRTFKSFKI